MPASFHMLSRGDSEKINYISILKCPGVMMQENFEEKRKEPRVEKELNVEFEFFHAEETIKYDHSASSASLDVSLNGIRLLMYCLRNIDLTFFSSASAISQFAFLILFNCGSTRSINFLKR